MAGWRAVQASGEAPPVAAEVVDALLERTAAGAVHRLDGAREQEIHDGPAPDGASDEPADNKMQLFAPW